jgi:plastocyanin
VSRRAIRFFTAALFLAAFGASGTALAAPRGATTVNVTIQNFAFSPATLTIQTGDTVVWTNLDTASHSAVTGLAGFATVVLMQGQSTTTLFERPGTYDYVCGIHGASMKGTIVVRGAPVADTPRPSVVPGHVVVDTFAEARPDQFADLTGPSALVLYASALLALVTVARFVWVLRH